MAGKYAAPYDAAKDVPRFIGFAVPKVGEHRANDGVTSPRVMDQFPPAPRTSAPIRTVPVFSSPPTMPTVFEPLRASSHVNGMHKPAPSLIPTNSLVIL